MQLNDDVNFQPPARLFEILRRIREFLGQLASVQRSVDLEGWIDILLGSVLWFGILKHGTGSSSFMSFNLRETPLV